MFKFLLAPAKAVLVTLFFTQSIASICFAGAPANRPIPYYGDAFYSQLGSGVSNDDLKATLQTVLRSYHIPQKSGLDLISDSCSDSSTCYQHVSLGYGRARTFLFGQYYLVPEQNNAYGIREVYCGQIYGSDQFKSRRPGPNVIPDENVVNTEHTWPQSKFTGKYPTEMQKSDLHHLFPTDSKLNGIRGNQHFGEVAKDNQELKCKGPRFGTSSKGNEIVFEPPAEHRGNVARAIFYFAVKYDQKMDRNEEETLRKWNHDDPVDAEELNRNDQIQKVQGSRNPFVDYPELIDRIANF